MPISTPARLLDAYHGDPDHFRHVLDHLFVPAIQKAELEPIRPIVEGSAVIQAEIIKNIEQSDLVLCDMSALNPNVFFELGIRTAIDKPACMVVDEVKAHVPFDTSIVNYHKYSSRLKAWELQKEIERLSQHIRAAQGSDGRNPLWRYFGLSARAGFSEEETGLEAKIDLMSMRLESLAGQVIESGQAERVSGIPEHLLYGLKVLAREDGLRAQSASRDGNVVRLYVTGGMPSVPAKARMEGLARTFDLELSIAAPFSNPQP